MNLPSLRAWFSSPAAAACFGVFAGAAPAEAPPFRVVTLSNGLTVLLSPSTAHPVIALSAFVTTGGRTEDEHYQGSLHYIEHLVYKGGTPNLPPTEFRKKLSTLGREAGGWTWDDEINFGFEAPKENFSQALGVFHEALHDLQFEKQWFEDEKRVVLQEMHQGLEEPRNVLEETWDAVAFDAHPYGRPVIGTEEAILALDMNATEHYYRERFTPNHMIVSVAGDFDDAAMLKQLEEAWGKSAKGPDSFELGIVEPEQKGPRRRTEFLAEATSAMVLQGFVTKGGADADTPAMQLLAELMNHPSFGLPQFLQQQEIWVSDVSAYHGAMKDFGTFKVYARVDPAKEAAVESFVEEFLYDFDARSLPKEAFETTRRVVIASEERARETAADRAERLGFLASRMGTEAAQKYLQRIASLTADEVQAAKERWIKPGHLNTVVVFPESFDTKTMSTAQVQARPPAPPDLPSLEEAGALEPPSGTPAIKFQKTDEEGGVVAYSYANGLHLLVRPTAASSLVAINGRMAGGQWVEPKNKPGINRFLSELGISSTRRWNEEAFTLLLGSMAATASPHISIGSRANTSRNVDYRDSAAHHYTGLSAQWPELLACLKESMFFPAFDSTEVEKVRTRLLTEVKAIEEDQLEWIKQEFYVRAYGDHPYGRPTIGTEESIKSITPADLEAFHRAEWTPNRAVVVVVGDVKPEEVATFISKNWADIPATSAPAIAETMKKGWKFKPPSSLQTLNRKKDYWTVNWGRPGVSYNDPSYWTSTVLSQVAGNDHFYKYVYSEGVSYRSWIRYWANLGAGTWILENDVKRERFDEILSKFEGDLRRYSSKGFTEKEHSDAVQRLVNSKVLDAQTNSLLAWDLAVNEGNGAGFRRATDAVDSLRAVKYEDVQALARDVFQSKKMLRLVQK